MMSVLSEGFGGWFRSRPGNANEATTQTGTTATTGGSVDQEPVVVWIAPNQMEAQIVKGRLESAGIPAIIRGEVLGTIFGLTTGTLAESAVLVPAALAEKAEALLQSDESLNAEEADQAE